MNFNLTIIFLLSLSIGCGVKSDPIAPPGTEIPSYINSFYKNKHHVPIQKHAKKSKATKKSKK